MAEDKKYTDMQWAEAKAKAETVKSSLAAENINLPDGIYEELVLGFLKNDFKARIARIKGNSGTGRSRGNNNG